MKPTRETSKQEGVLKSFLPGIFFNRKVHKVFPLFVIFFIVLLFYHKTILKGYVPMPYDLLVSEYSPFRHESYMGYVPGSYPNKAQYFDVLRQFYPWKDFVIEELKRGSFPLWNIYNFSGAPLFANHQSAILYPTTVLYLIFSSNIAWTITILSQIPLIFLATYLYSRKIEMRRLAAVFSSIAFSCSLFISSYFEYGIIGHSILYLPILLYLVECVVRDIRTKKKILIPISIALLFFAGHLQVAGLVFLAFLFYAAARILYTRNISLIKMFIPLTVLGFLIASVQLLPLLELVLLSARTNHDWVHFKTNLLFDLRNIILILSPDFFGNPSVRNYLLTSSYPSNALYTGIPTLFFALYFVIWGKGYWRKIFSLFAFIVLVFITLNPFSQIFYRLPINSLLSSTPTNGIFLFGFAVSLLGGLGFETLLKNINFKKVTALSMLFLLVPSIYFYLLQTGDSIGFLKNLFLSFILIGFVIFFTLLLLIKKLKLTAALFIVLILVFDLFYFFSKFNPFSPSDLGFTNPPIIRELQSIQGYDRSWGYSQANIESNFQTYFRTFSPDGYDPLYPAWYGEFIQLSKNGVFSEGFTTSTRSDALIAQGFGSDDFANNSYRKKVLNLLGVKYILDRKENALSEKAFPPSEYKLITTAGDWILYQNNNSTSRVFFAQEAVLYANRSDFERKFFSDEFNPAKSVLVEDKTLAREYSSGSARILSYQPKSVVIETKSGGESFLFLSDTYYPGWEVLIDGEKSDIVRTNYSFRGVLVPGGDHTVEFKYQPVLVTGGGVASLLGFLAIIIYSIYNQQKLKIKNVKK